MTRATETPSDYGSSKSHRQKIKVEVQLIRPQRAPDCWRCLGHKYLMAYTENSDEPFQVVCHNCIGRGWTTHSNTAGAVN